MFNSHDFEKVYEKLGINLDTLGCIMVDIIPPKDMAEPPSPEEETTLYYAKNKTRKWIRGWIASSVAHVTLLYGLLENGHNLEKEISKVLKGWKLSTVEIDHFGYFNSPYKDEPYYCIVAHMKVSDALLEGHERLELLPHINTFPGFKAHMTVCYIKKSCGKIYRDALIEGFNSRWAGKKLKVAKKLNLGYKPK